MRIATAVLLGLLALPPAAPRAPAAELIMVEQSGCHWCARWNEEIGPVYARTEEAARAPLRRVDIAELPDDIAFESTPVFTPTFVLVDAGKELGRIEGYPGEHFFWPLLNGLLDAHPDAARPGS